MTGKKPLTPERRGDLLRLLAEGSSLQQAADTVGVSLLQVWGYTPRDPSFQAELNAVLLVSAAPPEAVVPTRRVIALNDLGYRIGEDHHSAKFSDAQVEAMRDRHENDGIGYRRLAKEFGCSRTQARWICTYQRRNQWADRHKTVDK